MDTKKRNEINLLTICLAFILIIQFILIAVSNVKLIDKNIDCDNAKLFVHIMEIWKQKNIAIPDWSYVSTLELDCASILALPFYALTGNIYQAFAFSNIILVGLFITVLFYLFRGKKMIYPILAANLLCIPYASGMLDYYNMLFFCGSQYVLKVMLPILFTAVLVQGNEQKERTKRDYAFVILFWLLFFVSSLSSGIYVLMIGILPVTATYILYKILKSEIFLRKQAVFIMLTVAIGLVGIYLNNLIMGGAKGNGGMVIVWVHQVLANVSSCLTGIFELFGGAAYVQNMSVLSIPGIAVVAKCCVVIVFLICGIITFYKLVKKTIDLRLTLLFSIFIWNLFVLLITNTRAGSATYEYRYHLIGMIPLMCISSTILLDGLEQLTALQKRFFSMTGILIIIALNILSFPFIFKKEDTSSDLKELCSYCENLDLDYVYLYDASNDADMCRLIQEDGDNVYLCITPEGRTWAYDFYAKYVDGDIDPNKAIFVVNKEEVSFEDSFELFGFQFQKFDTVANRDLYYFVSEGMPDEIYAE